MATAKLFLHYAAPFPDQNARVLDRVRDALSILVAGREPEVVHAILANALVLAQRYPHAFAPVRCKGVFGPSARGQFDPRAMRHVWLCL